MFDGKPRLLILGLALALCGVHPGSAPAQQVTLAPDGWFRLADGGLFVPLGGFHGNVLPVSRLQLSPEERARLEAHIWSAQKTDGEGHVDLWDASDAMLARWFRRLSADGVTALRLFARARVSDDVLDLGGKLNPELKAVFRRTFAAARPYGIRFLLQILPEPGSMCYTNRRALERRVLPRYSRAELAALTPAQRKFLLEGKRVTLDQLFTDEDVLACQKQYLHEALEWIAAEPQVFALEIYNEQGWTHRPLDGKAGYTYTFPWEDAEIRWTAEIVRAIKTRLPAMPVTLSHPGFGVTGYDPLKWSKGAGVDFYSSHMYAGLCGENETIDFAAVTAATGAVIAAGIPNFSGEWGVFSSPVPMDMKRFSHRDAIWLSLLSGRPGFFQWTYEFPEEYRWASEVMRSLPRGFTPARPQVEIDIGEAYRTFQNNERYARFVAGRLFPAFPFNRDKQSDPNIQKILAAYRRSLAIGVPVAFAMGGGRSMSIERFLSLDASRFDRPIRAGGGYECAWMKDANRPLWIAYFRRRRVREYGRHFVGVPDAGPLEIRLDLPKGSYRARLIDPGAAYDEVRNIGNREVLKIAGPATADRILVISPARGHQ
jgi:hypothetical protein